MKILRGSEVPLVHMKDGDETRRYYESAEHGFRIVETRLPPGRVQKEHRHEHLLDIMLVVQGEIQITERDTHGAVHEETLQEGDLVSFAPPCFHNVVNTSAEPARTLTLKIMNLPRPGLDLAEVFRTDWIGYES